MKPRLLAMGTIISVLGVALTAARGTQIAYLGLLAVGVILLVLGILWRSQPQPNPQSSI